MIWVGKRKIILHLFRDERSSVKSSKKASISPGKLPIFWIKTLKAVLLGIAVGQDDDQRQSDDDMEVIDLDHIDQDNSK